MHYFVAFSCLFGVEEVGEEKLHHHALLVEILEKFYGEGGSGRRRGRSGRCGGQADGEVRGHLVEEGEGMRERSDLKEERKAESFALLMEATEKKVKLEERRTMIEKRKVALKKKKVEDRYRCGGRQDVDHKSGLFVCRCKNDHEFLHH